MKNIFVEGIQGAGKSTFTNALAKKYPQYKVCHEGDYNPVELAWCTWMTQEEYDAILKRYPSLVEEIKANTTVERIVSTPKKDAEVNARAEWENTDNRYIVTYTRILTDILGFHKDLENYEIYNGRRTIEELKEIVLSRYGRFRDKGYIFECAFFQNIVEDLMLFQQLSDDEIVGFYRQLFENIDRETFELIYLYSEDITENIRIIKKERSDNQGNEMWYPLMLGFLAESPYGKAHGYNDFDDMINHFKHRQQLEMRIIKEVIGENAKIVPAKEWKLENI